MTLIEKVRKEHPDEMNSLDRPLYCPTKYGYAGQPSYCGDIDYGDANKRCTECWNREIPETNLVIGDSKVEHPDTDIPGNLNVQDFINTIIVPNPTVTKEAIENYPPKILDSGNRRQFASGAVRDIQEGKGRCDLMPLDVVSQYYYDIGLDIASCIFKLIWHFKTSGNTVHLMETLKYFCEDKWDKDCETMFLEVSKHFEEGAKKYGPDNWRKGIPVHCYIDSAVRHYLKFLRGDQDEPHDRAFCWNIMCAIWTCEHKPELNEYGKEKV